MNTKKLYIYDIYDLPIIRKSNALHKIALMSILKKL